MKTSPRILLVLALLIVAVASVAVLTHAATALPTNHPVLANWVYDGS